MRTVDAGVSPHLGDDRTTVFGLIELIGPATTYRYTDAPISIVSGGFTWTNLFFKTGDFVIDGDGELNCTVTFEDASRVIRSLVLAYDLNDFQIKIYEAWADATNTLYGQDLIVHGMCDGARCDGEDSPEPVAAISVRGLFAASASGIGPAQDYTRNCRYHQFKGPECKYAGGVTSCDRTYATCLSLANTPNFGGFRFALEPGQSTQWQSVPFTLEARPVAAYVPAPVPTGGTSPAPSVPRHRAVTAPVPVTGRQAGRGR